MAEDGTASGRFLPDDVYFMPARPHAAPPIDAITLGVGEVSRTGMDPSLLRDHRALFAAQLAAPQAQHAWAGDTLTLDDVVSGSHADVQPSESGWVVHQHGPHRLWDDIEKVLTTWLEAGKPHQSGFGLTVTPDRQWVWLDDPDGPRWDLPA